MRLDRADISSITDTIIAIECGDGDTVLCVPHIAADPLPRVNSPP
jgi:hypothetical protein